MSSLNEIGCNTGTRGLPDMSTLSPRAANYYVTLPLHTIGFTIFIVVLITFDCGFEL